MPFRDALVPAGCAPADWHEAERAGVSYLAADWEPAALAVLLHRLAVAGAPALAELPRAALTAAWLAAVEAFLDPGSPERRALDPELARTSSLSPRGLSAALATVLGGTAGEAARSLLATAVPATDRSPVAVFLAGNLPALGVQPLLPALAVGRPVLLKSSSAEPIFAPAFLDALRRREPRLEPALAAVTWRGGDEALEAPVLAGAGRVLAYGDEGALAALARRAGERLVGYGPKTSLAVLGAEVEPDGVAAALARDVALFDQRGCLSIHAVYTARDPCLLAAALAAALEIAATELPPGAAAATDLARVQQARAEAELRGLPRFLLSPAAGGVFAEDREELLPPTGLRTVRVHHLDDLSQLPRILAPWAGRLQGAALAGDDAWALAGPLTALGVSRLARPGRLQAADALWHNGGVHPLAAVGGGSTARSGS